jgi:hypothetical protein
LFEGWLDKNSLYRSYTFNGSFHLIEYETDNLAQGLGELFNRIVRIARIKHGNKQIIDTLIIEEAPLLAKYLK